MHSCNNLDNRAVAMSSHCISVRLRVVPTKNSVHIEIIAFPDGVQQNSAQYESRSYNNNVTGFAPCYSFKTGLLTLLEFCNQIWIQDCSIYFVAFLRSVLLTALVFFIPQLLNAQTLIAGVAPQAAVGVGYSYLNPSSSDKVTSNLLGFDANFRLDMFRRAGFIVDYNRSQTARYELLNYKTVFQSILAGPVFYPFEHGSWRIEVKGLIGASKTNSYIPFGRISSSAYVWDWSYSGGVGAEYRFHLPFAINWDVSYLRTRAITDSSFQIKNINNIRFTTSLVYTFRSMHIHKKNIH